MESAVAIAVTQPAMPAPRLLMCRPAYYGIEYEINPWMNVERPVERSLSEMQWRRLCITLERAGAIIEVVPPEPGLPDLVFTANAGLVAGERFVLSNFRYGERQPEAAHFARAMERLGFEVVRLPEGCRFEGAGDALFCGETLYAGYGFRSNTEALTCLGEIVAAEVVPLELCDPRFYHLDTCFCPVTPDLAIWYPAAFTRQAQRAVEARIPTLVPVSASEAAQFAANAVVVGNRVITNEGCPHLHRRLRALGFRTVATPLGEFVKAGGSAKCLTLRLDGEQAARPALELARNGA